MTRSLFRFSRCAAAALALAGLVASWSCGKSMLRQGDGPSYLIVDSLQAAPGATPTALSTMLSSDVVTNVKSGTDVVAVRYDDIGQVQLRMALKDQVSGFTPTDTNAITISGYHVEYVPSTPGDAVPQPFDGALTGTITTADTTLSFVLVRSQAKMQLPLSALAGTSTFLPTVARVTFTGHDQAGHAVTVTASISVTFADWMDPK